ncbi:MAG: hypothetical protein ACLSA6_18645 [Holdemania massiliensis]
MPQIKKHELLGFEKVYVALGADAVAGRNKPSWQKNGSRHTATTRLSAFVNLAKMHSANL